MPLIIFCDEFGNTGGQLFDPAQPILVYSFVILQPAALESVTKQVQSLFKRGAATPSELKSSRLLRSRGGRRRFAEIGQVVCDNGARICLSIVEKRYQVCSLIRDTFLDPFENEFAPKRISERHYAQKFAEACYDSLSDARLGEFLSAVEADVPDGIAAVGRLLSATLRFHPDDFVSEAASCIETRPDKVFRRTQKHLTLPMNAHIPASQYAGFHPGLERVEMCLRTMGETGDLLRDHDAQFGEALDEAYAAGRQLDQLPGARAYGAQFQLNSIRSCVSASSTQQLGLQLADLAAGVVGRIARDQCLKTPPNENLSPIIENWRAALLDMERHYVMVSDAKLDGLAPALFGRQYSRFN